MTVVAFLLTNLNPDLRPRTHSLIYRSVKMTLLRTKPILDVQIGILIWFQIFVPLKKLFFDRQNVLIHC